MNFIVQGTDQSTGQHVRLEIDAGDRLEALRRAASGGILVSSAELAPGEALSYVEDDLDVSEYFDAAPTMDDIQAAAALEQPAPPGAIPHQLWYTDRRPPGDPVSPEYPDILSGAKWLRVFAVFSYVTGVISIIASTLAVLGGTVGNGGGFVLSAGLWGIIYGVFLIGMAAILRMLAAIGLAIRDVARNSHRS